MKPLWPAMAAYTVREAEDELTNQIGSSKETKDLKLLHGEKGMQERLDFGSSIPSKHVEVLFLAVRAAKATCNDHI